MTMPFILYFNRRTAEPPPFGIIPTKHFDIRHETFFCGVQAENNGFYVKIEYTDNQIVT